MHFIGTFALNLSFIVYLFLYVPQLARNLSADRIVQMSLHFHALLWLCATADLFYGFGRVDQWQYRVISVVFFILLSIQQAQLWRVRHRFRLGSVYLSFLACIVITLLVLLFLSLHYLAAHDGVFVFMGWVERVGYWSYCFPQLYKNRRSHSAEAISPVFLILAVVCALCDAVSAWCFHWGSSSLVGAPIAVVIHLALLMQWYRARQIQSTWVFA